MPQASIERLPLPRPHSGLAVLSDLRAGVRLSLVRDFLDSYRAIHPEDRLPGRRDFEPMAIPHLLPNLMLVEVAPQGPRFRVKVVGEAVAMALPLPLHGRWLDDIRPEEGLDTSRLIAARRRVAETGRPEHWYGRTPTRFSLDFANLEYLHCPLAEDGTTVDHILTIYQSEAIARED